MQLRPITHFILFALALTVCLVCARVISSSANTGQQTQPTPLQGEAALTHLKQQGQYDSLQEAMRQARYTVQRANTTPLGRPAWHAPNPAAGYDGYITEEGVSIALKDKSYVSLTLRGIGYGYSLQYVGGGEVSGDKQSLTIKRDGQWSGLKEWYVNGEGGLEQGFTLNEPPGGSGKRAEHKLRLALSVNEDWRAVADEDGKHVTLLGSAEGEAIDYSKLVVWDANGSPVKAALLVEDERVIIEVNDATATYPLTIDPVFALQQKITASDGTASDRFGSSVALDGNLAVVGSYTDDIGANADQGSAYVFIRQGAVWSQQAKLVAADGAAGDFFGYGLAVSGETVVVGAFQDDVTFTNQGSAYVFTRSGTTWTQQAKLTANDAAADDGFGYNVGISGDTVVIGAYHDDVTGVDQGSAYVFTRTGLTWSPQQKLIADDGAAGDLFGYCVTISGDTIAVGAVFDKVLANVHQGSAYVFTRSGATWMQQQHLNALTGTTEDLYGGSISLSGNTLAVGAYQVDVGGISNKGTVYVYTRIGTTWSQQAVLIASDGAADDLFGSSVALSGNTLVVGAIYDDVVGIDQGSAYVFTRSGTTWAQQSKLTAADGAASDFFGGSVAISGDTVMVGANGDDVGANADQGSVYFFTTAGDSSVPQAQLLASDGAADDIFGYSVAISGDTAVIGAYLDDVGTNSGQGSAYVFIRSGATWNPQQKLTASDGAAGDFFGSSVAVNGDTVVVGASGDDFGTNINQGSAYVFIRSGATWTQQPKLSVADGEANDFFGASVAISGETIAVGAYADDVGANANQGSAYVFVRSGTTWSQQAQLNATGGAAQDQFGISVALSG
ncbi:MAG TPA: hypothetical protein PLK30_03180, partial [Blastocatellia bacterium]|nr:hypothetical protein [Blastocatellia bacterium]